MINQRPGQSRRTSLERGHLPRPGNSSNGSPHRFERFVEARRVCCASGRGAPWQACERIVEATSAMLVRMRYSICLECIATQGQPGGQAPSRAQCSNPNMHRHSTMGSSNTTHRSYNEMVAAGRASETPPPTPRRVRTSFLRAKAWMTFARVGREIPVAFAISGICTSSGPARASNPRQVAATPTCRVSMAAPKQRSRPVRPPFDPAIRRKIISAGDGSSFCSLSTVPPAAGGPGRCHSLRRGNHRRFRQYTSKVDTLWMFDPASAHAADSTSHSSRTKGDHL